MLSQKFCNDTRLVSPVYDDEFFSVSIHRMIIRMRVCFFLAMFHNSEVGSSKSMFKTDENVKDFFAAS